MKPGKYLGTDGFNPGFQHFVVMRSSSSICDWLATGVFPYPMNMSNNALIPKGDNQVTMKDWHPILLCIVYYKFVAKFLTNHQKIIFEKCFSKISLILDIEMVAI